MSKQKKEKDTKLEILKFLGKGNNGIVYLLSNNRIIKICTNIENGHSEAEILEFTNGNKYFPRIYEHGGNYIIREYIGGTCLKDYIKKNGLEYNVAVEIIELLKEFYKLKFRKKDIRCKDMFIQEDGTLRVIDPKGFLTKNRSFPRHLCKGLDKLGYLDCFIEVLRGYEPELYNRWINNILEYRELWAKERVIESLPRKKEI